MCLLSATLLRAQTKVHLTPYFQLGGMYYSSKQITSAGVGPGFGLCVGINEHFLANSDVNLYWINGNAGTFRLALGYKKSGVYTPAGFVRITSIFGQRTEFLLEDGSRPVTPVFSYGVQLSPLRFENNKGFVSILEVGYSFGNYQGKNLDVSLLSMGVKF